MFRARAKMLGLVAMLALVLAGTAACASPPDQLQSEIEAMPDRFDTVEARIDQAKADYEDMLQQPEYAFIADYTAEQQHLDHFDMARDKVNEARQAYENELQPIVDDYSEERQSELQQAVDNVNGLLEEATTLAGEPTQWAEDLAAAKDSPESTLGVAEDAVNAVDNDYPELEEDVAAAKEQYPDKAGELDERFTNLSQLHSEANESLENAASELDNNQVNWAVFLTGVNSATDSSNAYQEGADKLRSINVPETRTLIDMRIDYMAYVSRAVWDDGGYDEQEVELPVIKLGVDAAEYFDGNFEPGDELAVYHEGGWGGDSLDLQAKSRYWEELGINPDLNQLNDLYGSTGAGWYYGGIWKRYCQKLHVVKDGEPITSADYFGESHCSQYNTPEELSEGNHWVEVDGSEYLTYEGDLGMDIYTKPTGMFASEVNWVATPPGMTYVGNSDFGEWQEDGNGNSFWVFYGQYAFFSSLINSPDGHYSRSHYRGWQNVYPGKSYYGPTGSNKLYGTGSAFARSHFGNSSHYFTSGLPNASVRGAGPAVRGGGPGGGGK